MRAFNSLVAKHGCLSTHNNTYHTSSCHGLLQITATQPCLWSGSCTEISTQAENVLLIGRCADDIAAQGFRYLPIAGTSFGQLQTLWSDSCLENGLRPGYSSCDAGVRYVGHPYWLEPHMAASCPCSRSHAHDTHTQLEPCVCVSAARSSQLDHSS